VDLTIFVRRIDLTSTRRIPQAVAVELLCQGPSASAPHFPSLSFSPLFPILPDDTLTRASDMSSTPWPRHRSRIRVRYRALLPRNSTTAEHSRGSAAAPRPLATTIERSPHLSARASLAGATCVSPPLLFPPLVHCCFFCSFSVFFASAVRPRFILDGLASNVRRSRAASRQSRRIVISFRKRVSRCAIHIHLFLSSPPSLRFSFRTNQYF
jgi:hypothetical protein